LNKLIERFQGQGGSRQGSSAIPTPVIAHSSVEVEAAVEPVVTATATADLAAASTLAPDIQAKVDAVVDAMLANTSGSLSSKWTEIGSEKGIKMWQQANAAGSAVRGFGRIKGTIHAIERVLESTTNKTRYDEKFISFREVDRLDDNTTIVSEKFSGIWPVAGRDFCAIQHVRTLTNGTRVLCGTDFTHPKCPEVKGFVRGEVILSGLVPHLLFVKDNSCHVDISAA
jgi:hypothetical protein